jgi:hypothetical protein
MLAELGQKSRKVAEKTPGEFFLDKWYAVEQAELAVFV